MPVILKKKVVRREDKVSKKAQLENWSLWSWCRNTATRSIGDETVQLHRTEHRTHGQVHIVEQIGMIERSSVKDMPMK